MLSVPEWAPIVAAADGEIARKIAGAPHVDATSESAECRVGDQDRAQPAPRNCLKGGDGPNPKRSVSFADRVEAVDSESYKETMPMACIDNPPLIQLPRPIHTPLWGRRLGGGADIVSAA